METSKSPVAVPPADDLAEVKKPTSLLIAQFFLFPLIIIAICVGIFMVFGYLIYEQRGPGEYLGDIQTGSGSTRWLAAVELSNQIATNPKLKTPEFVDKVLTLYVNSKDDDPRVRRFLALTLGKLGDKRAVGPLVLGLSDAESLKSGPDTVGPTDMPTVIHNVTHDAATLQEERREAQIQNQIYTLMALGLIGDNAAVPGVVQQLHNDDSSVRKFAAYILGYLNDPNAIHDLQVALNDVKDDVRWNAAIALARLGDASGADVLMKLTDRSQVETATDMTPDQKSELMANAIKSLALLKSESARDRIKALSETDPDLNVRGTAIEALKSFSH
jgi:HEAT repeat protein